MPGLATHCVFGAKVLSRLPDCEVKSAIRQFGRAFYLGSQGPDLFCYNFLRLALPGHRNLGAYLHNNRVRAFFAAGFASLPPKGIQRQICLAYLAGAYCHYVCDSTCHTFVYARTQYDPKRTSVRYYGRHAALEADIDAWYMQQQRCRYTQLPQEQIFRLPAGQRKVISWYLARVLDHALGDLFLRSPFRPAFVGRALTMASLESMLLTDPQAQRKQKVEKWEKKLMKFTLLSEKFITDGPSAHPDPMNFAHNTWRDPWKPHRVFCEDFHQLFERGVRLAVWMLPQMEQPQCFLDLTGDTNYHDDRVLSGKFARLERAIGAGESGELPNTQNQAAAQQKERID